MNVHFGIIIVFAILLVPAVSQALFDSLSNLDIQCGNDQPLDPYDSLWGPKPDLVIKATEAALSPDGRMLAFLLDHTRPPFMWGTLVYNVERKAKIKYFGGEAGPRWHPDGKKLLTAFMVYNLETDELIDLPVLVNGRSYWSPDGKYIYYHSAEPPYMFRSTSDGKNLEPLENLRPDSYPLTDSTFFSFVSNGIEIINTTINQARTIEWDWMRNIGTELNVSVSRDGRYILADFWEKGRNKFNGKQFLGMVDLQTNMLKKVLPSQRLGNNYYPSWTSNGTIIVSYVCRVDSVYAIWEIDTNGVFLRQLVGKDVLSTLTSVEQSQSRPSAMSIQTLYPHPVNGMTTAEYEVHLSGSYSLALIDLSGREVRSVKRDSWHEPGRHAAHFRKDDLPAGLYLLRLSCAGAAPVYRKLIVE